MESLNSLGPIVDIHRGVSISIREFIWGTGFNTIGAILKELKEAKLHPKSLPFVDITPLVVVVCNSILPSAVV